jgi:glutaminyl-tRNA synthetase
MERRARATSASFPGNKVRLRYGYVVECTGCDKDANGNVIAVHCELPARHQERHARRRQLQGQGQHALGFGHDAYAAEVRSTTAVRQGARTRARGVKATPRTRARLPRRPQSGQRCRSSRPGSSRARERRPEERFQFERHGYFVADRIDSKAGAPVFNRAVGLSAAQLKDALFASN